MPSCNLVHFGLCLSALSFFVNCSSETPDWGMGSGGSSNGTGSTQGAGGTINGSAGGNTGAGGGNTSAGGNGAGGGNTSAGGNTGNSGGGGNDGSGGTGFNPDVDESGQGNAKAGDSSNVNQAYLKLGEIRILNNNWGSEDLNCGNSAFSVFVNDNKSFGWTFDRGSCGGGGSKPDFPQIEFGVHPFGQDSPLATSPDYSSTSLLPLQIKDINSASVNIENLNVQLDSEGSWNITFEFWVSERDPLTADAGVYAEVMTFWGWQGGRWPEPPNGEGPLGNDAGKEISSGEKTYKLWVQDDSWAEQPPDWPQGWRYFQFRDNNGPQRSFSGRLDVKPFIDYLVSKGYSQDFWITRLEVGSEIDDGTKGKVTLDNISFEINNETRSAVIAE